MDQQLRLKATMQNEASAEVRRLARDLGTVKTSPGMNSVRTWFHDFASVSDQTTKAIRPLSSGLSTIGVSGLAAGLSITGLIGQFRDLARAVPALQELSRQSGISRTEIERLKYAAQNLNVDPSKMTAAIATFSEQMIQFEKHSGKVYNEMAYKSQGLANKIASEWRGDPAKALQDYLGWLNAIPEAQQRMGKSSQEGAQIQRHWTQEALGYADMAQIFAKGPQGFADAYVEATKNVHEITDELVAQSDAFNQAINRFDNSWNNLKNDLGTSILPALTAATEGLRKVFDMVKAEPALAGVAAGGLGAVLLRRRIMSGSTLAGGAGLNRAAGELTGAASALKGAAAALERGGGPGMGPGGPVNEAEKDAGKLGKFGRYLPLIGEAGFVVGGAAAVTGVLASGDPNKAMLDGGRPDTRQDVTDVLPGLDSDPDFARKPAFARLGEDDRETRARAWSRATNTDGNALHRNDEMPAGVSASDLLATVKDGTKSGVLAGFREMLQQQELDGSPSASAIGGAANLRYGRGAGGGFRATPGSGGGMPLGQGAKGGSFAGSGANAALAKESYDFWRSKGLDHNAALSMVSQEQGESGFDFRNKTGDGGSAHGAFQWHGNRRQAILAATGINIDTADHRQQLEAAFYEGTKGERAGFLQNLNGRSLGDAVFQGVHRFEGSANQVGDTAKRLQMAKQWDGGGSFMDQAPGGSSPVSKSFGEHVADMKANGLINDEQCVTLAMASVGIRKGSGTAGANVHDWRKGVDADQGTLVPGTPVATFLNRDGQDVDRYADGGAGRPGAGLDHAGLFQSYILDAAGKRIGMKMSEQFAGSGGVHVRDYLFGKGFGEHNGSAYHAVLGPDGKPLGGAANPFTTAEALRKSIPPAPAPAPEPAPAPTAPAQGQMQGELHIHLRDGQKPRMVATNKGGLNMRLSSGPTMVPT